MQKIKKYAIEKMATIPIKYICSAGQEPGSLGEYNHRCSWWPRMAGSLQSYSWLTNFNSYKTSYHKIFNNGAQVNIASHCKHNWAFGANHVKQMLNIIGAFFYNPNSMSLTLHNCRQIWDMTHVAVSSNIDFDILHIYFPIFPCCRFLILIWFQYFPCCSIF